MHFLKRGKNIVLHKAVYNSLLYPTYSYTLQKNLSEAVLAAETKDLSTSCGQIRSDQEKPPPGC